MHPFDRYLCTSLENIEFNFGHLSNLEWANFILNPRRLRGSDFSMRWSQGQWSEERVIQAVSDTGRYFALPYGPSGVAPDGVREFELYFERLEKAGLGRVKRPDLLVFRKTHEAMVNDTVQKIGGIQELPFVHEDDDQMQVLLSQAMLAIECENSLWRAQQMPDYDSELKPQKRLHGQLGLKKSAVVPTVILKEEDRAPLRTWQAKRKINIHLWHVFYDMAFGLAFDSIEELIRRGLIEPTQQVFQAPGGATTQKTLYKIYYQYAYPLGTSLEEPSLIADHITDKNGHILPYVKFAGGRLQLSPKALEVLGRLS